MLILLAILIFVYNFAAALFEAGGFELSMGVELLYLAAFLCGVIWWLRADAGRSVVKSVYCQGLLIRSAWLVIIPYHLLKTRGAKGLLPLLLLAGSFVLARIAAAVVYFSMFGSPPGY